MNTVPVVAGFQPSNLAPWVNYFIAGSELSNFGLQLVPQYKLPIGWQCPYNYKARMEETDYDKHYNAAELIKRLKVL